MAKALVHHLREAAKCTVMLAIQLLQSRYGWLSRKKGIAHVHGGMLYVDHLETLEHKPGIIRMHAAQYLNSRKETPPIVGRAVVK
ncbi:hypothetical protein IFM46972_02311 [Aspergillus udagawae]|uniref:Uncharacterized protein n=1 Tax=Aspergillus udagawae TaxID=91492 RepID=A0A8H3N994_9EURO|nr:hypothetical protein IFM46972_02311 [Aspergillus udagawae]